ncbi:hypothetical protein AB0L40_05525 [Patulibacter sp. NPDC049589]|uniref:hypothetical protein n=1 Tax=Patulibacter sp. NPDC049589 TaxID=3154731 RepID=UPI003434EFEB
MLLVLDPAVHPVLQAAAVGPAIVLATGPLHRRQVPHHWLRVEEPFALLAGVLIVTLGPAGVSASSRAPPCSPRPSAWSRGPAATSSS